MVRSFIFASALLAAGPALSQSAPVQGGADPAPSQAAPVTPDPSASAAQQPAPATTPQTISSIIDAEFPAYDANKDGQLDQSEFARWMTALKDQEMKSTGANMAADQLATWVSGAFSTADKDKSANVSKPELVSYLSSGTA